jgi:leucyl aminopeptidase
MEWSSLVNVTISVSGEMTPATDFTLIGIWGPPKPEDDDDEEKESTFVPLQGMAQKFDQGGGLTAILTENVASFNGAKLGSVSPVLRVAVGDAWTRRALLGLGPQPTENVWPDGAGFKLGAALAEKAREQPKITSAQVLLPSSFVANSTLVSDFVTAFLATLHVDTRYFGETKTITKKTPVPDLKSLVLVAVPDENAASVDPVAAAAAIERGTVLAKSVVTAKDIVNAPHNILNSVSLADTARRIAEESPNLSIKVLGTKECEDLGMGSYLAVARGSETPPQFIHITYRPPASDQPVKKLGCIGKGLLFDTGGYNIKTMMMEYMKFDCGGSAAVLGAARAIGALQPPGVEVHFIVAACENMINEKAYVASDIITASNGKTIEVMNTDAEGRLTLADALVYADKTVGCDSIIELSTLTGACMVSLGQKICGMWTSNDELAAELSAASKATGDTAWRMPMANEYADQLESKFADLKNIGGKYGGAITAALFLQNFVSKKKPFAHLDIAGPVWDEKTGATGFGAKLVVEWITRQAEKK